MKKIGLVLILLLIPVTSFAQEKIPSPLKQIQSGVMPQDVKCNEGFVLIMKTSDSSSACVKLQTAQKLVERGWGVLPSQTIPQSGNLENYKTENLTLYVSDQSEIISPVDITIHIDGKLVVQGNFNFSSSFDGVTFGGHINIPYQLSLKDGTHKIDVESIGGNATLEREFEINGQEYAIVDYWYDPTTAPQKHFDFEIGDEPPGFA
jgi:hypothetical protein